MEMVNSNNVETKGTHHALTALLLGIIPGGGQFYNKQIVQGLIFFVFLVTQLSQFRIIPKMG